MEETLPEPRREGFKEKVLPEEPKSDVKVVTDSGMVLRERVVKRDIPEGISLIFTYTRLDEDGNVMLDKTGEPFISDPHEITFPAEGSNRNGMEGIKASLKVGREVAVARATDYFNGLDQLPGMLDGLLASRLN